jgi:hypothetical protein
MKSVKNLFDNENVMNGKFLGKAAAIALAVSMAVSLSACGMETFDSLDEVLPSVEGNLTEPTLASQPANNKSTSSSSGSQVFSVTAEYSIGTQASTLGTGEWMPYVAPQCSDDVKAKLNTAINKVYNSSLNAEYVVEDNSLTDAQAQEKVKKLFPLAEKVACATLYSTDDSSLTKMKSEWADVYEMSGVQASRQRNANWTGQVAYARPLYAIFASDYTYVYLAVIYNDQDGFNYDLMEATFDANDSCTNIAAPFTGIDPSSQVIAPITVTDEKLDAEGKAILTPGVASIDFSVLG